MYIGERKRAHLGRLTAQLFAIPDGEEGVKQTLKLMRLLVQQHKLDPNFREIAHQIFQAAGVAQKDWSGEVKALHAFVRDKIRYVKDINGVETVQTPDKTLQIGYGDCDDKATLLATLLEATGHPAQFVAIGTRDPHEYQHVYVETKIGPRWYALETTEPVPAGWAPPKQVARMVVTI